MTQWQDSVEVFWHDQEDTEEGDCWTWDGEPAPSGWYYWACQLGCIPDGDPIGPFQTEGDAWSEAEEWWGPEEGERTEQED